MAEYNGWTNYETWCVNLWMDNEHGQQDYWADEARQQYADAVAEGCMTRRDMAALALADRIKEEHQNAAADSLAAARMDVGPLADLLRAALSEVNWQEIARNWIDSYCEEV